MLQTTRKYLHFFSLLCFLAMYCGLFWSVKIWHFSLENPHSQIVQNSHFLINFPKVAWRQYFGVFVVGIFLFFEIIKLKFREISRKLAAVLPCCVLGGKVLFLWWDSMNFFDSCWHPTTFGTRRVHEKMALQSVLSRYAHNTTGIQFY